MSDLTYTYDWYRGLLGNLLDAGHDFHGFDEGSPETGVLLRHDVDWSPDAAREMAEIEAEMGVTGTYFVLVTGTFYNALEPTTRETLADIAGLGHDVGLHFDPGAYFETTTLPEQDALRRRVEEDERVLRGRVDRQINTIAFHNPPDWAFSAQFEGIDHTYEPRFFDDIAYRSDSLGRWRDDPPFAGEIPDAVQVLIHPGLWGPTDADPKRHIREAQREMVSRSDASMERSSRLEWSAASLEW